MNITSHPRLLAAIVPVALGLGTVQCDAPAMPVPERDATVATATASGTEQVRGAKGEEIRITRTRRHECDRTDDSLLASLDRRLSGGAKAFSVSLKAGKSPETRKIQPKKAVPIVKWSLFAIIIEVSWPAGDGLDATPNPLLPHV